jgi:hypothetical protein
VVVLENLETRQDNSITIARIEQAQQILAKQQFLETGHAAGPIDVPNRISTDNNGRKS